ncbi:MAG: hypothetical protein IPN96_05290 [Anaerolineales bacterium]|nr:hypothetical protein [Anaerolineales bacterium]
MLVPIHEEMTRTALGSRVSPRALEVIIAANRKQDALHGQPGHDEYHFDNNAIDAGHRYITEQRGLVLAALLAPWCAFRLDRIWKIDSYRAGFLHPYQLRLHEA